MSAEPTPLDESGRPMFTHALPALANSLLDLLEKARTPEEKESLVRGFRLLTRDFR